MLQSGADPTGGNVVKDFSILSNIRSVGSIWIYLHKSLHNKFA